MNGSTEDFLPKHELARVAVERARQIVKDNNAMIAQLKLDAQIADDEFTEDVQGPLQDAENFSYLDSHVLDFKRISSHSQISSLMEMTARGGSKGIRQIKRVIRKIIKFH